MFNIDESVEEQAAALRLPVTADACVGRKVGHGLALLRGGTCRLGLDLCPIPRPPDPRCNQRSSSRRASVSCHTSQRTNQ